MGKVAVWRTIGETFGFTFGRYPTLLGVVWLPLLLLGTVEYFVLWPLFAALPTALEYAIRHPQDPDAVQNILRAERFVPAMNLLAFLIMAWISVGITKEALGLRTGPRFVYLGIGLTELRAFGAYLLFFVLLIAFYVATVLGSLLVFGIGALVFNSDNFPPAQLKALTPWAIAAAVAFGVAYCGAVVCVFLRLLAFLLPVIVVEKRFDLVRSWNLSKGNVWRLFVIAFLMFVAFLVVELVVFAVIGIPVIVSLTRALPHGHVTEPAAVISTVFKSLRPYLPFVAILALALAPILYGLQFAPWAFAYRSLVPAGRPDAAAAQAA